MDKHSLQTYEYSIQVDNLFVKLYSISFAKNKESIKLLTASQHSHSYVEIFACESGCIHIQSENSVYTLHSGELALVPSGLMHQMTHSEAPNSKWASIGITCSECSSKNDRNLYRKISGLIDSKDILTFSHKNDFYTVIEKILSTSPTTCEPWLLLDFVSELSKLTALQAGGTFSSKKDVEHRLENMDRFLKLDHYIHCNFMNELSNKDAANELHISERQLSRLVLAQYGTTLHTQICRKRITVAAQLLIESKDSVETIALSVGFKNKMSFYREFKKAFGMTPAQFRTCNRSTTDH